MLSVVRPSTKTMEYITRMCAESNRFLRRDLQEECPSGYRVSIDIRERIPGSYCWSILVQAPPLFFGDFREIWEELKGVEGKHEVSLQGTAGLAPLLKQCLNKHEILEDVFAAGHVYFLKGDEHRKNERRPRLSR